MNSLAQEAIIVGLARRLQEHGSWCGETHIQKSAYLASELLRIPFGFDFILYKHGPFSFELREEIDDMRVDGLLERVSQGPRYGPRLLVSDRGHAFEGRFERTMQRYEKALDWIAEQVKDRGVLELERLATALWVTRQQRDKPASAKRRANELVLLKPHVSPDAAISNVEEIDKLIGSAPAPAS
jgi:uncharacterized protein YwgA